MAGVEVPETQFARSGEDRVAFQVFGNGEIDLLFTAASGDALDLRWYWPPYADFMRRLGAHARVIMFDRRGSGSSDRASGEPLPGWEQWKDDARAVLDAADSERAVILGMADGGPVAVLFAASHPHRTRGLILANTTATYGSDISMRDHVATKAFFAQAWGTPEMAEFAFPDAARDPAFLRWFLATTRLAYNPSDAADLFAEQVELDVRDALASVRVPTLVLHREHYAPISIERGRYLAEHIPDARFAVLPGNDVQLFTEPVEPGMQHIQAFLHELHGATEPDRALAAILFTDFVGSTKKLASVGDHAWRNLLDSHDLIARTVVEQHAGHLIKTTGDGILATFDGPGRAIHCAIALRDALRPLGLDIRAGLHTGEVELRGTDIAGIAVHIAARVLEAADAHELLVSAAVPMLVAGAGFEFDDRGQHELKGIDGPWQLFAVRT